ncbi:MAG: flagellar brake protein [Gallionella sp.]|nr:flagellar brake protein [Gallionella sp.]
MKYETLSRSEENEHGIVSAKEIVSILKHIAENGSPVALYYVDGNYFILTTLLGVNETGLWLEQSTNERDNKRILESDDLIFVSTHLNVKVQFVAKQPRSMEHKGYSAFYLPLPKCIYRLQRRDSFRADIPATKPLHCTIPVMVGEPPEKKLCEVTLLDISAGGMKINYGEKDIELVQGDTYENCQIKLPELGTITVTMIVRSMFSLPTKSGHTVKRAGCQFINVGGASNMLLQRYVNSMQRLKNVA